MRGRLAILILVVGTMGVSAALQAQSAAPTGCYRFDRPLGFSATGDRERGDSSWYRLQLLPEGKVARPALAEAFWRDRFAQRSAWHTSGDTLFIRVSTGLVGWDLTLLAEARDYVGTARYLTDAVVLGAAPLDVRVRATRDVCPPSARSQGEDADSLFQQSYRSPD